MDGVGAAAGPLSDAKLGCAALSRLHDDLHIVARRDKETHQAFDRIAAEPAGQHGRDLGLIDSDELCRGCLGQLSLADGAVDPDYQAGFDRCSSAPGRPRSANTLPVLGSRSRAALFGILHLTSQLSEPLPNKVHFRLRRRDPGLGLLPMETV